MIFIRDGLGFETESDKKMLDEQCSIRLNVSDYVNKYKVNPPMNLFKLPEKYLNTQRKFFKRAYKDVLEKCS